MTRWLVGSSMRARGFMAAIAAVLVALGALAARDTQLDALPEFGSPTVEIQTEALGLSAPEVEQLITVPLEQDLLAGIPWLDTMRSESIPGLSSIELVFDPGTDLLRARQVVQERLTQAAGLPNVSGPPQMLQPRSATSRVMMIRLSSRTISPIELSVLARWTIRPKLLGVPGVANVSIWGQKERQLQVQVDPDRLRDHGVTLDQIVETSGNALWASPLTFLEASTPGTGGFIDTAQQRLSIQHLQPISTADDLAEVPIAGSHGALVLGDVASVVEDHQPLIGDAIFTDGEPGLLLVIEKLPGTGTQEVTRGIDDAVASLRPGLAGVDIDTSIYRPAAFVERSSRTLGVAAILALLLIALALAALLFDWRSVAVASMALLTSIAVAVLVLYLRRASLNEMMLAGLVMGLLVVIDDVIVDVTAARGAVAGTGAADGKLAGAIAGALRPMRTSAACATVIAAAALAPAFFVPGRAAPFVPPVVLTFALVVVASLLVALTITPALCALLRPGSTSRRREGPALAWLGRGYARALTPLTSAPRRVFAGAAVVVLAALLVLPFLSRAILPSFRDGNVLIDVRAVPGTSLPEMDRITDRLAQELAAVPGVADVGAQIGRAIASDQVVGVDTAQLWVRLDPEADADATLASIRAVAGAYPGLAGTVRTYADEQLAQLETATDRQPLVVRMFGQNLDTLREQAARMQTTLAGIEGVTGTHVDLQPQQPTVNVAVDLQRAERVGVVPGDVRRAAATLMSGIGVGSLFEEQKVFDVVVWGTPETRNSLGSVRDLLLDTARGPEVKLGTVADVSIASTPTVIDHNDDSRTLDITVDVSGRDTGAVADDIAATVAGMTFPLEYHAEVIDNGAGAGLLDRRVLAIVIAAAIAVLLLFQAVFGSWRLAIGACCLLPVALTGCAFAAALSGGEVSLGTWMGAALVVVLAIRMVTALFRHAERLQRARGGEPDDALVRQAARDRSGAVLSTAIVGTLVALVVAIAPATGHEVIGPMAAAAIGGLLTAALTTLFVAPAVYLRSGPAAATLTMDDELVVVPDVQPAIETYAQEER